MLDAHPQLAIPPETQFVPELIDAAKQPEATPESLAELLVTHRRFGDFGIDPDEMRATFTSIEPFDLAEAIRSFYRVYAEKQGKPRWGDKSPGYGWRMRLIDRNLPEARFIHLIRDGRDVSLSLTARQANPPPVAKQARHWRKRVRKTQRQGRGARHYMELRYEDLIRDPEAHLHRICEFVELPFDDAMLRYHERATDRLAEISRELPAGQELYADHVRPARPAEERLAIHRLTSEPPRSDRIEKWRSEMSPSDRAEFERVAGALLVQLGYEVESEAPGSISG